LDGEWEVGVGSITCKSFDVAHLQQEDETVMMRTFEIEKSDKKIEGGWLIWKEANAKPYFANRFISETNAGVNIMFTANWKFERDNPNEFPKSIEEVSVVEWLRRSPSDRKFPSSSLGYLAIQMSLRYQGSITYSPTRPKPAW
jgi:hypothetical protein